MLITMIISHFQALGSGLKIKGRDRFKPLLHPNCLIKNRLRKNSKTLFREEKTTKMSSLMKKILFTINLTYSRKSCRKWILIMSSW